MLKESKAFNGFAAPELQAAKDFIAKRRRC